MLNLNQRVDFSLNCDIKIVPPPVSQKIEVPVTHSGITFVEAVKQNRARLIDIDDWVEVWHTTAFPDNRSLREYLGFDTEMYAAWMRTGPDALMSLAQ